uniref:Uncharacterized protein n=1 Tax=Strigamia maritima TaxID=126957 RepID=T1J6K9_STRMM
MGPKLKNAASLKHTSDDSITITEISSIPNPNSTNSNNDAAKSQMRSKNPQQTPKYLYRCPTLNHSADVPNIISAKNKFGHHNQPVEKQQQEMKKKKSSCIYL